MIQNCPFCGDYGADVAECAVPMRGGGYKRAVYCNGCFSEGPPAKTDDEAIAAWNRRPTPEPQGDSYLVEARRHLHRAVREQDGSMVSITKADACAIGIALAEPQGDECAADWRGHSFQQGQCQFCGEPQPGEGGGEVSSIIETMLCAAGLLEQSQSIVDRREGSALRTSAQQLRALAKGGQGGSDE